MPRSSSPSRRNGFAHFAHHAAGNAGLAELLFPLRRGPGGEQRGERLMHFAGMLAAQVGVREARIGEPILATNEARQRFELRLLHDAQRHLAPIGTHEHAGGGLAAVADVAGARQTAAR